MKKLIAFVCAAVMTVGMAVSVYALPSPTVSGIVTGTSKAVDSSGNSVKVVVEQVAEAKKNDKFTEAEQKAVEEIKSVDKVKELMGDAFAEGMQVVDVQNVRIEGDAAGVTFPLTITFKMTGVTKDSKVSVLHYDTAKGAWEVLESKTGDGTVEAVFNSLSPVAFVVDKDTAANMEKSAGTSPKTGESNVLAWTGIVAVVALMGMALTIKNRKREGI